jgi:hypothetical protein
VIDGGQEQFGSHELTWGPGASWVPLPPHCLPPLILRRQRQAHRTHVLRRLRRIRARTCWPGLATRLTENSKGGGRRLDFGVHVVFPCGVRWVSLATHGRNGFMCQLPCDPCETYRCQHAEKKTYRCATKTSLPPSQKTLHNRPTYWFEFRKLNVLPVLLVCYGNCFVVGSAVNLLSHLLSGEWVWPSKKVLGCQDYYSWPTSTRKFQTRHFISNWRPCERLWSMWVLP